MKNDLDNENKTNINYAVLKRNFTRGRFIFKLAIFIIITNSLFFPFVNSSSLDKNNILTRELIEIENDNFFEEEIEMSISERIIFNLLKIDFSIRKFGNVIDLEDFNIPSDLIEFFQEKGHFEVIINQGRLPENIGDKILLVKNDNKITNTNQFKYIRPGKYFSKDYCFSDLPAGMMIYIGPDHSIFSRSNMKFFFDIFSYVFKITLSPILDLTNYVNFMDHYIMTENTEKACSDHLDGIRNILPFQIKKLFDMSMNYKLFTESDYKSIKIHMFNDNDKINFSFRIIYMESSAESNINSNYIKQIDTNLNHKKFYALNVQKFMNKINNSEEKIGYLNEFENLEILNNIDSKRFLTGETYGFDNFKLHHIAIINSNNNKIFRIIDLIPSNLDIFFSTINLEMNINLNKIIKSSEKEFFNKFSYFLKFNILDEKFKTFIKFFFTKQVEKQNPRVPYTYEDKSSIQLNFVMDENFFENFFEYLKKTDLIQFHNVENLEFNPKSFFFYELEIKISYELRKKILNFESIENENELGYKIPSGFVVLFDNKNLNASQIKLNNHLYFNMPDVDGTMPFNIIALSWVLYGFIFIQTLNLFLIKKGEEEKTLLQSIKDRFMAKWGFLFGR